MLTPYVYSRHGIMYEVLYEVFHAVIQFAQYTFIYVSKGVGHEAKASKAEEKAESKSINRY
jgi:hypothetical protein